MDKQSGGMNRIMSFFIRDEEPEATPTPKPILPTSSGVSNTPPSNQPVSQTAEGVVDKKYAEHFEKLLEQANFPGPDYFEFAMALKNMANLGLTEDKLYQATYATFQAMGGSTQILLHTAQQYMQTLRDNQTDFERQVHAKTDQSVGQKSQERDSLVAANQQFVQQILELQAKIEANNARVALLNDEISVDTAKINNQQNNYQATLALFVGRIEADVIKIKQYLEGK
ncbi:MAG: hypothetical protein V4714_17525 [Bacteroidota bacterium]